MFAFLNRKRMICCCSTLICKEFLLQAEVLVLAVRLPGHMCWARSIPDQKEERFGSRSASITSLKRLITRLVSWLRCLKFLCEMTLLTSRQLAKGNRQWMKKSAYCISPAAYFPPSNNN